MNIILVMLIAGAVSLVSSFLDEGLVRGLLQGFLVGCAFAVGLFNRGR
jgi:hypothetical protein